ncbi:MAG TPA: TonB-dependent receptor [Gemmatimonadaceae bacterium]|nr:TonB-dependent receptor [Gemmatimonadaceae bacterium]
MRVLRIAVWVAAAVSAFPVGAWPQAASVSGTVRDAATQRPLAGVTVEVSGAERSTTTRADGRFELGNLPPGPLTIRVRYIGYRATSRQISLPPGGSQAADFNLTAQPVLLDEVVVTGVGVAQEARRLGTSTGTINAARIAEEPIQNVTEALTGRIAGVLPSPRGEAGAWAPVRLRGQKSMTQRNDPIVYVNGVRVDASAGVLPGIATSRINDISPQDIERVEVIKGAAAATLFGTEASSGVIQIFTKRGREGAPQYRVSVDQEVSRIPLGRLDSVQAFDRVNNRLVSNYPAEAIFRTGYRQAYALEVSGGTQAVQYFTSGRFMNEDGATRATGVRNMSLRTSVDMNHGSKLRSALGVSIIRNRIKSPGGTFGYIGVHMLANPLAADSLRPYGEAFATVEGAANDRHTEDANTWTIDGRATYDWRPNLRSQLTVGHNQVFQETSSILERGAGKIVLLTGRRILNKFDRSKLTVDFNTSWQVRLSSQIGSSIWAGAQGFFETNRAVRSQVTDFPAPGLETLSGGATISTLGEDFQEVINAGVFSQWQLDVQDRLFVTAGVRADGNSAFGEDFGVQTYPKFSVSYVLSDAPFWPGERVGWDVLRVRGAYGTSGLQPGAFDAVRTYRPRTRLDNRAILWAGNVGNPDLRPERSHEIELGSDMSLFDGRLGIELTSFWQRTEGAIMPRPLPASQGFLEPQLVNVGRLESNGIELLVSVTPVRQRSIGLSMSTSIATLDQKVTDLGGLTRFRLDGQGNRSQGHIAVGYAPGAQIGVVLDPANPYRTTVSIDQLSRVSQIAPNLLKDAAGRDSLVFLGNPMPSLTGTFSTELSLGGNLTVRAMLSGASGFTLYNESSNIWFQSGTRPDVSQWDYELAQPSTSTERRTEIAQAYARKHPSVFGNWVFDGDYLRFHELSLQYQVPATVARVFGAGSLSVNLVATNLALWTRCEDCVADPGAAGDRPLNNGQRVLIATERFNTPSPRRLGLSVRLQW